jgi:hypothetical protein
MIMALTSTTPTFSPKDIFDNGADHGQHPRNNRGGRHDGRENKDKIEIGMSSGEHGNLLPLLCDDTSEHTASHKQI